MDKTVKDLLEQANNDIEAEASVCIWAAVRLAMSEAEGRARQADPRDYLSAEGKFRHRIDAAIAHLQKIKSTL